MDRHGRVKSHLWDQMHEGREIDRYRQMNQRFRRRILVTAVIAAGLGWLSWSVFSRHRILNRLEELWISKPEWESRWLRDITLTHPEWRERTMWCHLYMPDAKLVFAISDPLPDPVAVAKIIHSLGSIECIFLMDESEMLARPVLEAICDCPDLDTLAVVQVPFSRDDWDVLAKAKSIRQLELESTSVDDEVLMRLSSLHSVETLSLTDLPVTSRASGILKSWSNLKKLFITLDDPTLTAAKLRAALPGVDIRP